MGETSIAWTERTWNPVRGCSRISPGCVNCYAERMAARNLPGMAHNGEPFAIMQPSGPRWTGRVELIPHMLDIPLKRRKPTTYFVNSMSDLFGEWIPDEMIDRVFAVMALCPQHTFQVLTKRAERMREYLTPASERDAYARIYNRAYALSAIWGRAIGARFINENVWLGVSVEDQQRADERIPDLLATPASVRFVSAEPLLGPVDLRFPQPPGEWVTVGGEQYFDAGGPGIDWVIVGGESGPDARPCDVAWIRSILQQCKAAGVACFVKQLGARPMGEIAKGIYSPPDDTYGKPLRLMKDPKGGDMAEWPEDLRVREMPR